MLAAAALLAVLARVIVPAGFMPAQDGGRFLAVVLCTGYGPVDAVLDLETGEAHRGGKIPSHDGSTDEDAPCVFAAAAPLALPVVAPSRVLAIVPPDVGRSTSTYEAVTLRLAAPPPWATAPPHAA
jgi:hypothetical protein